MTVKSKTAEGAAVSVDMKSTAYNYGQYTILVNHFFLCDSISSQQGGHHA